MQHGRGRFAGVLGRLLLELVIVFVGVYLAFLVNEYGTRREQEARRAQLRAALASEISVFIEGATPLVPALDSLFAGWDSAYAAGSRPMPLRVPTGGIDMPPRGMWQAVIASDPLATLDVATMQSVSDFYNGLDVVIEKYDRLRAFDEASIIPRADDGAPAFYEGGSTELRPEYRAYMSRFRDVVNLLRRLEGLATKSRDKLTVGGP